MSLDTSLSIAFCSLKVTEAQLATSSANVTNASKDGYTVKTYEIEYISSGSVTTPSRGITVGSIDYPLYKEVISDINDSGYYSVLSDAMDSVSTAMGSTDGTDSLSSSLSDLQSALEALETSPDDTSQKQNVVLAAQSLASALNELSESVQTERLNANNGIADSVDTVNSLLNQINDLNASIQSLSNLGQSTADLEDERMVALESLSEQIGINYFFDSSNNIHIYTDSGDILLNSTVHELSYSSTSYVTSETTYPGEFSGIALNGKDITSSIDNGKLRAYIKLRDTTLADVQDSLDAIATSVMDTVNSALSSGSSYPAPTTLTGNESVSSSDTFSATGTLRVAIVDADGIVQSLGDIDLSAYSTVGDLISGLSSISGVSASLNSQGQLTITSINSSYGVALNQMDSSVGSNAESFSSYVGINTLFNGDGAEDIAVSTTLLDDYTILATGTLSDDAALAVGDRALTSGNVDAIANLVDALSSNISFSATGVLGAQDNTISSYISNFMSYIANEADNYATKSDNASSLYESTKSALENATGVNVDEETIKITQYQNQYEAAATLVSTLQDMFATLLEAVN
ncbi:MAG: flagellar hook-associated protein FlgK [Pseudobdellovibrionaceae bacterium]